MKPLPASRENGGSNQMWLIIFSDMSTNLMLFFLMLFAITRMTPSDRQEATEALKMSVDETAREMRVEKERKEADAVRLLKDTIVHGKLKQYTKIEEDDRSIKLTLELPVFFPIGSADLTPTALDALESLMTPLKEFPNDIVIEGHTDNIPITGGKYPSNWELSVARAVSVIDFFTVKGVNTAQMVAGGYGEYHPLYPNDTEANRSKNRRIEITIIRQSED